MHMVVSGLGD